jgi:CRISPR-associated protein Csb2
LFQALLAACAKGGAVAEQDRVALEWLEKLPAPTIGAPVMHEGARRTDYVPNNDLDSKGGDPSRIADIRTAKLIRPHLFDSQMALVYRWSVGEVRPDGEYAFIICRIADSVYQFGRGVDMAWASAELLGEEVAEQRLLEYTGVIYRPCESGNGSMLLCPQAGSVESLLDRYRAQLQRFGQIGDEVVFNQPPKPRFRQVPYNSPAKRMLYELRAVGSGSVSWPLTRCAELAERVRDRGAKRLAQGAPERQTLMERVLVGRGATDADKAQRVRVLPLPSIGHKHADRGLRRVLVEVPPNCPVRSDDIDWAFSGLTVEDEESGEILFELVPAPDEGMLRHYAVNGDSGTRWRTVTPVAISKSHTGRKFRRDHLGAQVTAAGRLAEQGRVAHAVRQALRHAGLSAKAENVIAQSEPFEAKGVDAARFEYLPRFDRHRLWHVELTFSERVPGPLVIGDGRYLGLGLMAPVAPDDVAVQGLYSFDIVDGLSATADPFECARALRRAMMSRAQAVLGQRRQGSLPKFFTGHEPDGSPSRDVAHAHLAFAADLIRGRLWVIAPHLLEGRGVTPHELADMKTLARAVDGMDELRTGASGLLRLQPAASDVSLDPLLASARVWESVTDYHPTRHHKRMASADAMTHDVKQELVRRGLPAPESIELVHVTVGPRGGLSGRLRLSFAAAIRGPLLLGRTRHAGGGLFCAGPKNRAV